MSIDGQSVAQIKAEVTAANTTEASFRSGMDHVLNEVNSSSFPSGTTLVFYQASAPTGWTKITTHNDKALRVVSGNGGGSGGSTAFSSAFSHTHTDSFSVSNHTLITAEIPSHVHGYTGVQGTGYPDGALDSTGAGGSGSYPRITELDYEGGGQPHNHGLAGSINSATLAPYYVDVIICTKG